jgi:PAS domain S-box-containing protein
MEYLPRILCALALASHIVSAGVCPQGQDPKRVLFLQSYHVGQPMEDGFVQGIRQTIDSSGLWIELHVEYMDGKRYPPPLLDTLLDAALQRKYAQTCFNAMIVSDNIALDYSLARRGTLFKDIPLIFLGVNNYSDSLINGHRNITGLVEDNDLPGTLDLIHTLQPEEKVLYLVTDLTETGWRMRQLAEKAMVNDKRWEIRWLQDETYASLLDSLANPGQAGAALVLTYSVDRKGTLFSEKKFFGMMAKQTRKPVYVMLEHQVFGGIVGGSLLSGREHGRMAGGMLVRILSGTPADSIPILKDSPKLKAVDYSAMARFGIPTTLVPQGVQIWRPPFSPWRQYLGTILATGCVVLFLLVCIIVLLRMRAELRLSREQYRELVDHANTVILRWDPQGRVQFINEFGERLFGYTLPELKGKNVIGTIVPEQETTGKDCRDMIAQLLEQPKAFSENENENITKDGQRLWLRWHNHPRYNAKGDLECIFSVGSDITEKRVREEDISRFNYKVAHDLRAPLITVNAFASMLPDDIKDADSDAVQKDIDYIRHAASRMATLLDELMNLSRVGRSVQEPTRFAIAEAVEEARKLAAGRLEPRKIQLDVQVPGWIVGERPRFVEVFQNLLDNAAKHMGDQLSPRIEVGILYRNNKPILYFRDNGTGIAATHLKQIFDLFVKVDENSEGTGLGLSLVKRIIETQGGRIWAESEGVGHGSTFLLMLDHIEL